MAKKKQVNNPAQPVAKVQPGNKPAPKVNKAPSTGLTDKWAIILLVAIALLVNAPTIGYKYTYDDEAFTSSGNLIDIRAKAPRSEYPLGSIPELMTHAKNYCFDKSNTGSYRPLLPVSFAIERMFGELNPAMSHSVNLILFGLMIMVLFKVLRRMFPDLSIYIPFFILLLYELHPIHIEVIASVKSRDELMAVTFTGLAILQSFKWIDNDDIKHMILACVYFLLAMLSKESPIGFIATVPLTLYFFTKADLKKSIISSVPYIMAVVIFILLRISFLDKAAANADVAITENFFKGATNFATKLGTVLLIQLKYFIFLLYPHPLSFDYSYNQIPIVTPADYRSIISLVIIIALLVYAALNFKKKDIFAYCILFYFINLAITSNLLMEIGAGMGERFLFISSFSFCIAVVFLLAKLFKADLKNINFTTAPRVGYIIATIAVIYAGTVFAGNEVWKDNFTLFEHGVEVCPNSWRTQNCIAVEYKKLLLAETVPANKDAYADSAIVHYRKSIAIYPYKGDTWGDLGAVYFSMKNYDSAIVNLSQAIKLNPKLYAATTNLGTTYFSLAKYPEAIIYYRMTLENAPDNIISIFNLAASYYNTQKFDSAAVYFKRAIEVAPDYSDHQSFIDAAKCFQAIGKMDSAAKYEALGRQYSVQSNH